MLVVDGGGSVLRALIGGNLAMLATRNGWSGVVVDGTALDLAELRTSGSGVRALARMPLRLVKRNEGQCDVDVTIQGVVVRPGDWLYADEDRIIVSATPLT